MANISQIQVGDTTYNICDIQARRNENVQILLDRGRSSDKAVDIGTSDTKLFDLWKQNGNEVDQNTNFPLSIICAIGSIAIHSTAGTARTFTTSLFRRPSSDPTNRYYSNTQFIQFGGDAVVNISFIINSLDELNGECYVKSSTNATSGYGHVDWIIFKNYI